ncbi:hypothetical protein [Desulfovibrio ferrophilus]|uniref:Uncharacterized protein n=1 Tax=Desulfovibrio ferrophilus TaxID=241368 RepID=A0A2Z6AU63_9BACT|nr:hypothetical protein [Desulfovibrio ferrophilus]BBD06765.1 uncharacterized protein DFE_0039 [Desulfovibrio ferrophilus]
MRLMYLALESGANVFDWLHCKWEREATHRFVVTLLALSFIGTLIAVEIDKLGLLPPHLSTIVPDNPFYAINVAFTLMLVVEVVSMIFILPKSFSRSMGKQFEILSLILLRSSFKELVNLHGTLTFPDDFDILGRIMTDGFGALAVFLLLGFYLRLQRHREHTKDGAALYAFVITKKVLALLLLAIFVSLGAFNAWQLASHGELLHFFLVFYSVLIFSDIFVVLISQRYRPSFEAVFRNSGLALATLLIRLALSAPPYWNTALGVSSALFAVCLTLAFNSFRQSRIAD